MRKGLMFFSLGLILSALISFLFRLIALPIFQGKSLWLIVFGILGLLFIILSFIFKKAKKFLLWFGLGYILFAVLSFGLRTVGVNNNITLFIITLIAGLLLLIIGIIQGG